MKKLAVAIALAFPLAVAGVAAAADPVIAAATVDRATITVGDPAFLTVYADAEVGHQVGDPKIAHTVGDLEVLEVLPSGRATRAGGISRWTFRYRITAWVVGDLAVPPIEVPYSGPNGTSGVAMTVPLVLQVTSVIRDGEDTSDVKPLKPQLDLPEALAARLSRIALFIVAAAAFTALAGFIFWMLLRRREQVAAAERLTPVQRALRELDALAEQRLPEKGKTAEHYELLTASLRRYAVQRFGIEPGRTSRELRVALERAGVDRTQAGAIYEILREGDEVRFRHAIPYPAHAQNAVRSALEVVRRAATAEEYDVVYERRPSALTSELATLGLDRTDPRTLPLVLTVPGTFLRDPAPSPDGRRIAFTMAWSPVGAGFGESRLDGDVYVANHDGTGLRRLTTAPGLDDQPAWSPTGAASRSGA